MANKVYMENWQHCSEVLKATAMHRYFMANKTDQEEYFLVQLRAKPKHVLKDLH